MRRDICFLQTHQVFFLGNLSRLFFAPCVTCDVISAGRNQINVSWTSDEDDVTCSMKYLMAKIEKETPRFSTGFCRLPGELFWTKTGDDILGGDWWNVTSHTLLPEAMIGICNFLKTLMMLWTKWIWRGVICDLYVKVTWVLDYSVDGNLEANSKQSVI